MLISGTDVTQVHTLQSQVREAQKMEALGTLASGIAHDFNNVLTSILGLTELSRSEVGRDSKVGEYLRQLESSVDRARDLVGQILTFRGGAPQEQPRPTLLQDEIEEVIALLSASLPANIEIRTRIDPDCGPVLAGPTHLHQLVMNLATNAFQAIGEEGGIIDIGLRTLNVEGGDANKISALSPGPHVVLSVKDTGVGMDRNTMTRIYDPFFSTKPSDQGTGLGLSVVLGIVSQLGGQILPASEPGIGSLFEVTLPVCDPEPIAAPVTDSPLPDRAFGNESLLFIDDESRLREVYREVLTKLGYRVTIAIDGSDALAIFGAQPDAFDLVISDRTMPGMLGPQLALELRAIRSDIPIILMSGGDVQEYPGVTRFLSKPFTNADLTRAIRAALDD